MCTVVIRVPEPSSGDGVRILAVRDEDPARPWRPLGRWWPEHPEVLGIQDVLAGGAWLAATDERVAVLLNRTGGAVGDRIESRGTLVMGSVTGHAVPDPLRTLGFNLVEATPDGARVTAWEGGSPRVVDLTPGTHMLAHDDVDDPSTARVLAWRDEFAATPTDGDTWWRGWLELLARPATLDPTDDRAIVRDNRPHGYPTLTLLVCAASLGADGVTAEMATLREPGHWNDLDLRAPR